jgi:hypothetical protein
MVQTLDINKNPDQAADTDEHPDELAEMVDELADMVEVYTFSAYLIYYYSLCDNYYHYGS